MVIFNRAPVFLKHLKFIYDKGFVYKVKELWKVAKDNNETLAYVVPSGLLVSAVLASASFYIKLNRNPVSKYYEYIVIYRPDDPRVKTIRKDDSLGLQPIHLCRTMSMPN